MSSLSRLVKAITEQVQSEELAALADRLAEREKLQSKIDAGPPAGSGISLENWRSWHQYKYIACPKKPNTTCTNPKCEIGIKCQAFAAYGLAGDGTALATAKRPTCGATNREGRPCGNKVVPGKRRCKFHGGLSTGPRTPAGRARIAAAQKRRWALFRKEPLPTVVDPYREADEEMMWDSFLTI